MRQWTHAVGTEYRENLSLRGHDGFLLEMDQVAALLSEVLVLDSVPAGRIAGGLG